MGISVVIRMLTACSRGLELPWICHETRQPYTGTPRASNIITYIGRKNALPEASPNRPESPPLEIAANRRVIGPVDGKRWIPA
uniref:hypothetical protein n=1 Tax=Burkholderia diffusa TaxID=488732 RepID=UPI001CC6E5C7